MNVSTAFALTFLGLMTLGVWCCAVYLSRIAESTADREVLSWGDEK